LKDIPLFVVEGEFDPLLDESISLVRKWPGKKRLDILPGLTHGFLFCGLFSKEGGGFLWCDIERSNRIGEKKQVLRWSDITVANKMEGI
jgi:hypothetical protein